MSRKRKLHASLPPLSFIDKLIYFLLVLIILFFGVFVFYLLIIYIPKLFATHQGKFLAYSNPISIFCSLPFILISYAIFILLISTMQQKKQPFFGNKSYKSDKPTLKVYPIFS